MKPVFFIYKKTKKEPLKALIIMVKTMSAKSELCSCEIKDFYVAVVQFHPIRRNSTFRSHRLTSVCFFIFANSVRVWLKFQKTGPGETRTLTPKALDPKSSASTNFATGPLFNFQTDTSASTTSQKLTFSQFLRQSATDPIFNYQCFNLIV